MKKILVASVLAFASAISSRASILGDTFQIDYIFPVPGSVVGTTTAVVPGTANFSEEIFITLHGNSLTVENIINGWSASSGFNGIRLTDLTESPHFTSFSLSSTSGNVPPILPVLSFDDSQLFINFNPTGTVNAANGSDSIYNFAFSATGVPDAASTLPLFACVAAGLVFFRRRFSR